MTREEIEAWVESLKPGDVAIQEDWGGSLYELHIKKITPTGIIRTEEGKSFRISNWTGSVCGYGGAYGKMIPATGELITRAQEQQKERDAEKERRDTTRSAFLVGRSIKAEDISFEFAKEFLELCKKHGLDV